MKFLKAHAKILSIVAVLFVLLIVASFCDLNISKAIADLDAGAYYSKNGFGVFWKIFGEHPVYIIPSISLGVIFFYFYRVKKLQGAKFIALSIAIAVLMLGLNYYAGYKLVKYLSTCGWIRKLYGAQKTLTIIGLDIVLSAIWFFVASRVKEKHLKNAVICALIAVIMAVISQASTQLIKPFFGRARFRMLNVIGSYEQYTNWYVINGKRSIPDYLLNLGVAKDGYKSFPSGHTSSAATVLALLAIPRVFKDLDIKLNIGITAFAVIYTIMVALSRIIMGAHYLSDVVFGALLACIGYFVACIIVDKFIFEKQKQNN